jgi:hypothetical protein
MKKMGVVLSVLLVPFVVFAQEPREPEVIYAKKCAMCHTAGGAAHSRVGPPITLAMKNAVIGIDAVDGPFKNEAALKEAVVDFLKDYLYEPSREKSNCEDISFERFGMMPSLKGFISEAELNVVVPWVYDQFKPKQ